MTAFQVRIAPGAVEARLDQLGEDISRAYAGTEPILITVLNGGLTVLSALVRRLTLPIEVDVLALGRGSDSGAARIEHDLSLDIHGRHVLIVEDIVDTGLTLAYLLQVLAARRPASLRVASLLDRRVRRIAELPLDFVGFEVGDEFLVGCGLDLDGYLRELPGVLAVPDRDAARAAGKPAALAALAAAGA